MAKIYQENARPYLDAKISVIPLLGNKKSPVIKGWSDYCYTNIPPALAEQWLSSTDDTNMGVCCGQASRFVALDIDYADDETINLIESVCPRSPYVRIGKKGKVIGFKYNGEKPFKLKTAENVTICELLSSGNQMCLEGSIHPETKLPYQSTSPLWKVIDRLPVLPPNFEEILRKALEEKIGKPLSQSGRSKVTDFVPAGARDTAMCRMSGLLAWSVIRGENTLKEAIGELEAWVSNYTQQVVGDALDIKQGISNLVTFLFRHVEKEGRVLPRSWKEGLTEEEMKSLGIEDSEENTAMSEEEIRKMIKEGFETHREGTHERNAVIQKVLKKIAMSELQSLSVERLLRFMCQSDRSLSIPACKRTLREYQSSGIEGLNHTEIAAEALKNLNELYELPGEAFTRTQDMTDPYPNLRFANDRFFAWAGANWQTVDESEIRKHIAEAFGNLPAAKREGDHKGILNVMKTLLKHDLKTSDIKGLNMANGFVTQDGKILRHDRSFGATYLMPFSYDPSLADLHAAPLFTAYLRSVWGEDADYHEKVRCLQEAIGATLFGLAPSFARAILLFGIGGTGKSQLLKIVQSLLPEDALSYVTPYNFNDKFAITELSRSLLNVAGELSESSNIPGDVFKSVLAGETMTGQYKGRPLFAFECHAAHWFASNHLPKSKDCSSGMMRRWAILQFSRVIPNEDKILNLGERIAAEERESIVAWAISGIHGLLENKDYHLPKSHFEALVNMQESSDSVFFYLSSKSESSPKLCQSESVIIRALFEKYSNFCYSELSVKPVGFRKFFMRLKELSLTSKLFSVGPLSVSGLTLDSDKGEDLDLTMN